MPWTVLPAMGTVAPPTAALPEVGARVPLGSGTWVLRFWHFMNWNNFKSMGSAYMERPTFIL